MERTYPIPVIVEDMLRKLNNPSLTWVERDNVCAVIEEIEKACRTEATRYRRQRGVEREEERREARKARSKTRQPRDLHKF